MPKGKVSSRSLSIIMLDPAVNVKKKYFPHTFLEAWKYEPKKIKMESHINNELEKCSSDESDNDSNDEKEFDDKKDNDESNE